MDFLFIVGMLIGFIAFLFGALFGNSLAERAVDRERKAQKEIRQNGG